MMEYKRLTDDELADFLQRACVQLVPELTQQLLSLGTELAEYRTKIERGLMMELPCMIEIFNGALWQVVYKTKDGYIDTVYRPTKIEAEEFLKELQK